MYMLKIFWTKKNFWTKASNIIKLNKYGFLVPNTFIISKSCLNDFNISVLNNKKLYIVRPSVLNEDWEESSYAWKYKSLYPLTKNEIEKLLINENVNHFFWADNEIILSIIIQEFIWDADEYGVYFTRFPYNIYEKWLYETWKWNDDVTSWSRSSNKKLNYIYSKELEYLWYKLEKKFLYPQDIEFCIKYWKIYLLQTRNITTYKESIDEFKNIYSINWIYYKLKSDEFWNNTSIFVFSIINNILNSIFIWNNIYVKFWFYPFRKTKIDSIHLNKFNTAYKKYLLYKILYSFVKMISFQKLDTAFLKYFFVNYSYSFDIFEKSNLSFNNFDTKGQKVNYITKYYLHIESIKHDAFCFLEKFKCEILESNKYWKDLEYLKVEEYLNNDLDHYKIINKRKRNNISFADLSNKVFMKKWVIFNSFKDKKKYQWIYYWKIEGTIVDNNSFEYNNNNNQILIVENLNQELYSKLQYLKWVIVKSWTELSHNSIILREEKIPSIVNYEKYSELKLWESTKIDE